MHIFHICLMLSNIANWLQPFHELINGVLSLHEATTWGHCRWPQELSLQENRFDIDKNVLYCADRIMAWGWIGKKSWWSISLAPFRMNEWMKKRTNIYSRFGTSTLYWHNMNDNISKITGQSITCNWLFKYAELAKSHIYVPLFASWSAQKASHFFVLINCQHGKGHHGVSTLCRIAVIQEVFQCDCFHHRQAWTIILTR